MSDKEIIECKECPFFKKSAPGWLGPWDAESLRSFVLGEKKFVCHKRMDDNEKGPVCVGSILFACKAGKLYRNKELREVQKRLKTRNKDEVLSYLEFKKHHHENFLENYQKETTCLGDAKVEISKQENTKP